ncbi:MAG: single-stranded DNA-binding protein [Bryobacterales bacterium]|nr:single-stranded DNA-binding protein [Bryobacterales bacterium]WKZ52655.1 MAG: single-stranded DNA-binding protein [Anaerolineales bacterium]
MSKQYNKLTFVGHLGGDPEMRFTPSGTAVTTFNVASNDQYTNEKGENVSVTTWFRCAAWGKLGEVCNQYLHKGSKVLIEGRLTPDKSTGRPRIWTRQDGTATADYELKILEIHFLDSRNGNGNAEPSAPADDNIPF